ncbi:hypothetical protein NQ315_001322 [Exocentrus adspersus]|uniref:LITAF domain-containing protein n=1 Tax=Exocentrus adspersus TaxID=1586481 RepID=A0AAV8WG67_9CUCU|nr:hypothetical protein NQ315_001322 [Exocentrus adspersus]
MVLQPSLDIKKDKTRGKVEVEEEANKQYLVDSRPSAFDSDGSMTMALFVTSDSYNDISCGRNLVACCLPLHRSESKQSLLPMDHIGKHPVVMTCPSCRMSQRTRVKMKSTKKTHIVACLCLPILFCWLPYVIKKFRVATHYCSDCGAYVGRSDT